MACRICQGMTLSGDLCSMCAATAPAHLFRRAHNAPVVPGPQAPQEQAAIGQGGAFDNSNGTIRGIANQLIDNFNVVSVSQHEASRREDFVGRLPGDTSARPSNRIDRQGPSRQGTYAKFAIQMDTKTFAGIEMEAGPQFSQAFVRAALRRSLNEGVWIRIFRA